MIQVTKHGQESETSDKEIESGHDEDDSNLDMDRSIHDDNVELKVAMYFSDSDWSVVEDNLSDCSEECLEFDSNCEQTESSDETAVPSGSITNNTRTCAS